ncbi:MAG: ACP S-malonyltransferase [Chitinispirillaceae bacterium]|nr:ACP S-malonyltransferase [Chitinispirillaceae bacterium]
MGKRAFLFPGQGSQEIGMGSDLINDDSFTRALFTAASDLVHEDLEKLCLHGPARRLMNARFLQPALVAVCLGYWHRLVENGIQPDVVLGHSLGEITSLAAAGIVTPEVCLQIAAKRGELMDIVAQNCRGGMLAILFVPPATVERLIAEIGEEKRLVLANDNATEQVVISGESLLLDRIASRITREKLGKCRRVEVVGPWHSPFMDESRDIFEEWVASIPFLPPKLPVIFNATAAPEYDTSKIKQLVSWQLTCPVFWRSCMETLKTMGVDILYEIGPQRILSGLARINGFKKGTIIHNINSLRGIDRVAAYTSAD